MKKYQAKPESKDLLSRAGLSQVIAARKAAISVFTLAHISAGRQRASATTAYRIARVYAEAAGVDQDAALAALFEEIAEIERPARPRSAGGKFVSAEAVEAGEGATTT